LSIYIDFARQASAFSFCLTSFAPRVNKRVGISGASVLPSAVCGRQFCLLRCKTASEQTDAPGKIKIRSMTPDMDGNSDEMSPSESERGDLLGAMKRYALEGYLRLGAGNAEQFEKMWREAFFANEPAKPISPDLSGR
jgi:hypothetical protein